MKTFINKIKIKHIILAIFSIISIVFVYNDYFLYETPILRITSIENITEDEESFGEKFYTQNIEGIILNGQYKGQIMETTNYYTSSLVYDDQFTKGSEIFVEISSMTNSILDIRGVKRDKYLVILLVLFIDLIILIAGKKGLKTLLSLLFNVAISASAIILYINHHLQISMLLLYLIVSMFFIVISLFITNGKSKKTMAAIVSSIVSLVISFGISFILLKINEKELYIWIMDYIEAVYDYYGYLYVCVLISGLGAIMDISITIASSLSELIAKNPKIDRKTLLKSGKAISEDIVGTMLNVMLFTCYTTVIPTILLAIYNNMSPFHALNFYGSIELTIVLCTSISIVLTIPISLYVSTLILNKKKEVKA
jgi:uncharacterized membrane protein